MSTYISMGARVAQVGVPDNTGFNTGNWTVTFSPNEINNSVPEFEVCKIIVSGAPGSTFSIWIDRSLWDANQNGFINSWDPTVPLPLQQGKYLYFYWNDPVTDETPPEVTIWLRYDLDHPNNKQFVAGYGGR